MINVAALDLETTGLDFMKGHRIIQVGLLQIRIESDFSASVSTGVNQLVNPRRLISQDSTAVHGITDEDVADAPPFEDVAPQIEEILKGSDILIAHNMDFDGPFLAFEMQRVGRVVPDLPLFCTMENGRFATGTGKLPKLQELCFALNVKYDQAKAHSAAYDAWVTARCFREGLRRGLFPLERRVA